MNQINRRKVLCQVFNDLSNFVVSPLQNSNATTKINIWVRAISNITGVKAGVIGTATPFYSLPYVYIPFGSIKTFGGIADNEIWKKITLGEVDSNYPVEYNPERYQGIIAFRFTNVPWNIDTTITTPTNQFDLYTVALHEMMHAMGFASLIDPNGKSILGDDYKYFSRYDTFLKINDGTKPLITNTNNCSMYNNKFNANLTTAVLHPSSDCITDQTDCSKAIKFFGTSVTPVYTPNCFEYGSSLSHFEDLCVPPNINDAYFTMSNVIESGKTKRFIKPEERNTLSDIGYKLNTTYGNNSTASNSFKDYGGSVIGYSVAGRKDGISSDYTYTFVGAQNTNIAISNILQNDINATSFICLEEITTNTPGILSTTLGTPSTIINFNSNISGQHILRYIPVNASGQKGNITYIYIYVYATNCATSSTCDLVKNGNFEQHNGFPPQSSRLNGIVCGWDSLGDIESNEYYHADNPFITPAVPLGVPCSVYGFENDKNGGKAYVGMFNQVYAPGDYIVDRIRGYNEAIRTKLKAPLLPNIDYQLSFDVSLNDGNSLGASKFEAFLSKDLIINATSSYIPISNQAMFFTNRTYSTISNGWETVSFTIPARTIAGEEYLYIGGALSKTSTRSLNLIAPAAQNPTCPQAGYVNQPYYFVDNVSLIPIDYKLNIPTIVCLNATSINLRNYLIPMSQNGIFSGTGVLNNIFNPSTAGVGAHLITFTYTNSIGCVVKIYSTINVYINTTVPTFVSILPFCQGETIPPLPTTSTNGIEGTWSPPATNNQQTTIYTFTGSCGTTTTLTISINSQGGTKCSSTSCQSNVTLSSSETSLNKIYKYKNWIKTMTNYTVSAGKTISFKAEDYLIFSPNTHFVTGSIVSANIETCFVRTSRPALVENDKDLRNFEAVNVEIFPNPFKEIVNIQVSGDDIRNIKIATLEGKIIHNIQDIKNNNYNFETEILPSGIYLVNIETIKGTFFNKKIIKN